MAVKIQKVTLIGVGKMGSQIAARAAAFGNSVHLFDTNKEALEHTTNIIEYELKGYFQYGHVKCSAEESMGRISFHENLSDALIHTDLVIESVPEDLDLKKQLITTLDKIAEKHTIIATNSSSIPASDLENVVVRKDKVLNIHFYAPVLRTPMVDIMRGTLTSEETFLKAKQWIARIGCIPLIVKKPRMGFVFNHIWHSIMREALTTWARGYADYNDIDRAWMIWSDMPAGPFGMMDYVGLDIVYDIEMTYYRASNDPNDKPPDELKKMIDKGELGLKSGKGFYDWRNPEFLKPEFLQPHNA